LSRKKEKVGFYLDKLKKIIYLCIDTNP
jgi:hypothetical protein